MKKIILCGLVLFSILSCSSDEIPTTQLIGDVIEPNIINSFDGINDGTFEQIGNTMYITRRKYSENEFTLYQSSIKYYVRPLYNSIKFSLIIEDKNGIILERRENLTGIQRIIEKRTTSILGNNFLETTTTDSYILKIITENSNEFSVDVKVVNTRIIDGQGATNFYVNTLSENN